MPQCFECGENADDLIGALFVFATETRGESFGILADAGKKLVNGGDLGREFGGPGLGREIGDWGLKIGGRVCVGG